MNGFRYWYLKHFNPDKALEELRKPVGGNYIVVQDGPHTWTRIKAEELESYVTYFREKAERYADAYEKLKAAK